MTGSTKPSSDGFNPDYHDEKSSHDPRLVDSLDPRLPKMANEIMTGLLNHNDNPLMFNVFLDTLILNRPNQI